MARIRSIKPEFWTDEKVVSISPLARLLFVGMWNFVDDEGRAEYSPARMKMQILPADSADMPELLGEIRREGLIEVYAVDGKEFFQVKGFSKHQKIDKRTPSKFPPPPTSSELPRIPPTEGKGKEGNTDGFAKAQPSADEQPLPAPPAEPAEIDIGSDEDRYWGMAEKIKAKGVSRSQMGQLANLLNGDFGEGIGILQAAAKARGPTVYLAKVIHGLKADQKPPPPLDPSLPAWVHEARIYGYPVEREGTYWRFAGGLFDDAKLQVGN